MAKKPKQIPAVVAAKPVNRWPMLAPAILFVVTLACYWTPLTSGNASILWDAADFFQPIQNYLSQELHAGRIPFWTPYPFAGFPFLADPQVGAWYPLNWPFFLAGVTPRALLAEHFLHALLACFGAYFLALRLLSPPPNESPSQSAVSPQRRQASVLAGLCYGLSGFFTGHSSHTPMIQCAAWLPWVLLLFDRALESAALSNTVLGGLVAGAMILAGHFQSALYGFFALALFAGARLIAEPARWRRIVPIALAIPAMGTLLSAIATGPGLELAAHSIRTALHAILIQEGTTPLQSLLTLVFSDYYGAASNNYHGPVDITQFYFYAGILLVPLAVLGLTWRAMRLPALMLFVPTLWYAMGPSAGLYLLIARLPGFASVRAPVNIWFVPALGLALLAAAGLAAAAERWRLAWICPVALAVFGIDLFYSNSANNRLAYARAPYEQLYGQGEDLFRRAVTRQLPALTRFDAPEHLPSFGPLGHYFDTRTEVTYGYDPLMLTLYHDYYEAMRQNPKLRDGLSVSLWLDAQAGSVLRNPDVLPRVMFPKEIVTVASSGESKQLLASLDQSKQGRHLRRRAYTSPRTRMHPRT